MSYTPGNTPNFYDFNSADDATEYEIIPKGTLAKVRMTIKPGGYDDQTRGLTGGWATHKPMSGAIYLNCEAVILEGPFAKRKLWFLIGLHSQKGPEWANIGRSLIKSILNSAHGLSTKDNSPNAQSARRITGMGDLDGIVFADLNLPTIHRRTHQMCRLGHSKEGLCYYANVKKSW